MFQHNNGRDCEALLAMSRMTRVWLNKEHRERIFGTAYVRHTFRLDFGIVGTLISRAAMIRL